MKNVLLTVAALFTFVSTSACADTFDPRNTLIIEGPIAGETMRPISVRMNELLTSESTPRVVNLIINSPGGSVYAGFQFITQMKSLQGKGTKFACYVPGLAASMAFHILTHCDKRVVLEESALLWHRARIFIMFGVVTAPTSASIARDLQAVDNHILLNVSRSLVKDLSEEDINYHFEHETLHIGQTLCASAPNFCIAQSHIPGLMEALNNAKIASTMKPRGGDEEEGRRNLFVGKESMVYIYSKYLRDFMKRSK